MRFQAQIQIEKYPNVKYALLDFFQHESNLLLLDSNSFKADAFDWALAAGTADEFSVGVKNAFAKLQNFYQRHKDWVFGSLSYDLKNGLEDLESKQIDGIEAPGMHFFLPNYLFLSKDNKLLVYHHHSKEAFDFDFLSFNCLPSSVGFDGVLQSKVSKPDYISNVDSIKEHIQRGDIYEMNYCQEFYAEKAALNPLAAFRNLNSASKAPFSCYLKCGNRHLISASPERFIKKDGSRIVSQPIKGTKKRGANPEEDAKLKSALYKDEKERSENVMIVDLVRNDLSKIAAKDSVQVDKLFEIYSFNQVHHMISTISCELQEGKTMQNVFEATFPMGSMTGAPKIKAMDLIEKFEQTKRGWYSGAVGYISPKGDFDFNVVIRSIQYHSLNRYLSFMVGSAITIGSNPASEYEECIIKVKALFEVLEGKHAK